MTRLNRLITAAALTLLSSTTASHAPAENLSKLSEFLVYVGTYTGGESKGIYTFSMDMETGELKPLHVMQGLTNPSFLAIHPNRKFLYAVGEMGNYKGEGAGAVYAFAIRDNGKLKYLNEQSSRGAAPCHLVVDATGKHLLVANYTGGSVASLPIAEDGKLGEIGSFVQHEGSSVLKPRQAAPHAHSINLDATNRFAIAADLGLDKCLVYRFDAESGELTPNDPPAVDVKPGAGPRHFAFHPSGKYAYVINEINLTMTAFAYDADKGVLDEIQTITTIPDEDRDQDGLSTAEVRAHPSGKFLYGSNRGHDTIVVYSIDEATGKLTHVENEPTQGKTPRNFYVDPTGKYLLAENQSTNSIVVFRIDQKTGALEATGHKVAVPSPVCIRMIPASK